MTYDWGVTISTTVFWILAVAFRSCLECYRHDAEIDCPIFNSIVRVKEIGG